MSKNKPADDIDIKDALEESEARFKTLTNQSPSIIFIHNKKKIVYVNDKAVEIMGYSRKEFYDPKFDFLKLVIPADRKTIRAALNAHQEDKEVEQIEYTVVTKSGKKMNTIINTKLVNFEGRNVIMGVITDISARKKSEEQIRASLKEKEVMLKEIHHRVKNNMQIISSLLRLHFRDLEDEKMQEVSKEMQLRIRSMALIHDQLYRSEDLSSVNLEDYIACLGTHLLVAYDNRSSGIQLEYDIKKVNININKAIPCGLVINELISNCFKYAFPEKFLKAKPEQFVPTISIGLETDDSGIIHIKISDNGVGFLEGRGLGMALVNDLVGQIDGTLERKSGKGTSFEIFFSSN